MLRRSRINPRLSTHTQIFGFFDYNRTPLASNISNGYGKAVAILEYQGGKADAFIPDQQENK
jgi:hypothetical protein